MSSVQVTGPPAQVAQRRSLITTMAERYSVDPGQFYNTLTDTVFQGATQSQLIALCVVANQYGLNPFTREIYAFPAKGGGIVPIVGIDGWLRIINEHPQFDGMNVALSDDGRECTVTVHRKDRQYPTIVTEYLDECKGTTDPWRRFPRRMLRHKAIIQAARVAFGFGGIYDKDDASVFECIECTAAPVQAEPEAEGPYKDVAARLREKAKKADEPVAEPIDEPEPTAESETLFE